MVKKLFVVPIFVSTTLICMETDGNQSKPNLFWIKKPLAEITAADAWNADEANEGSDGGIWYPEIINPTQSDIKKMATLLTGHQARCGSKSSVCLIPREKMRDIFRDLLYPQTTDMQTPREPLFRKLSGNDSLFCLFIILFIAPPIILKLFNIA